MSKLYFTEDHEWLAVDGDEARVGITDFAQKALGDVVFVELPELGRTLAKGAEAAVVESVKAASEVFAPVSGEVIGANQSLVDQPALVNSSPEDAAWFFALKLARPDELDGLMDLAAYQAFVAGLE